MAIDPDAKVIFDDVYARLDGIEERLDALEAEPVPPEPEPPTPEPEPEPPAPEPQPPSGSFEFLADGTLTDPSGNAFLPRGLNAAAGTHTNNGYFKGANLNNSNFDFVQLHGWLEPDQAEARNLLSYLHHLYVLKGGWKHNVIRLNVDGYDNKEWGSDPELRRVIKSLTDHEVVALFEQHAGVTGDDPSNDWIVKNTEQIGILAAWAAENLKNPNYFWYNPWNEPSGAPNSTYRGKKAYQSDAWVKWHAAPTAEYLKHLPGGIVVWNDVHVGQGKVYDEPFDADNSCVLTHGRSVRYGGAGYGVPDGGWPQVMFSFHCYQKWARNKTQSPSLSIDNGLLAIPQYAEVARDKKLPIMVGEIGGRNDELPAYLQGDEQAAWAFFDLELPGVGALWWGASVSYESGFNPGTRLETSHPNKGISRVPFWFFGGTAPMTYTGPNTGHTATSQITYTGRKFWDWCHANVNASPGWSTE